MRQEGYSVILPLWYVKKRERKTSIFNNWSSPERNTFNGSKMNNNTSSKCLHKWGFYFSATLLPQHTTTSDANRYPILKLVLKLSWTQSSNSFLFELLSLLMYFFFVLISSWFKILDLLTWSLTTSTSCRMWIQSFLCS